MTWQLVSHRVSVETESERKRKGDQADERAHKIEATVIYNLVLEITYHHLCLILLGTQTNPSTSWKGRHGM